MSYVGDDLPGYGNGASEDADKLVRRIIVENKNPKEELEVFYRESPTGTASVNGRTHALSMRSAIEQAMTDMERANSTPGETVPRNKYRADAAEKLSELATEMGFDRLARQIANGSEQQTRGMQF